MKSIDWVELWLLNRTIIMECKLLHLIRDVTKEHFGFWSFPEQAVMLADPSARAEALRQCVRKGFIELYSETWLQNARFGERDSLSIDQCDLADPATLDRTEAIATLAGHVRWEAEFQPDWQRLWQTDGSVNSTEEAATLYVTYGGDEILRELLEWLPDYFGFDKKFGLKEMGYKTLFQHQVTKWKCLPVVKVAAWQAILDNSLGRITELAKTADESGKQELREQTGRYFQDLRMRQQQARRILNRLSDKWDTVTVPGGGRHDTIPILRSYFSRHS